MIGNIETIVSQKDNAPNQKDPDIGSCPKAFQVKEINNLSKSEVSFRYKIFMQPETRKKQYGKYDDFE